MNHQTKDVLREIERYNAQARRAHKEAQKLEACRRKLIRALAAEQVGNHPAIDHHIVNTERRELTSAEIEAIYG